MRDRKALRELLPANKDDLVRAQALSELEPVELDFLAYDLLRWLRQESWPVATPVCELLVSMGARVIREVETILGSRDDVWKAIVLRKLVMTWPRDAVHRLAPRLFMVATAGQSWGADLVALRLLAIHEIGDPDWIAGWLEFKREHHRARLSEIENVLALVKGAA